MRGVIFLGGSFIRGSTRSIVLTIILERQAYREDYCANGLQKPQFSKTLSLAYTKPVQGGEHYLSTATVPLECLKNTSVAFGSN